MRGRRVHDPLIGVGWLLLSFGFAAVAEGVMVALGSPQHVWFWCTLLQVCSR